MKLVVSVVVLVCVGVAQAQGFMSPILDIFNKLQNIMDMEEKLNALREEVRELKSTNEEGVTFIKQEAGVTKVAFSATLSDFSSSGFRDIGPHTEARTLVYEHVFTNIGNAYDSSTGIFTAPVKGVYFFIFVVFTPSDVATGVRLLKNGRFVVAASDNIPGKDTEDTTGNSVSLLLEKGDQVHLQLIEQRRVYTDAWKRNTFSGHLLFTL